MGLRKLVPKPALLILRSSFVLLKIECEDTSLAADENAAMKNAEIEKEVGLAEAFLQMQQL